MIKTRRFILALLLCTAMLLGLSAAVFAEGDVVASGDCGANGSNVTWSLDSGGVLTISGSGAMKDYGSGSSVPWYSSRSSVKTMEISGSVTNIGSFAFFDCSALTSITIPSSVTSIGNSAFSSCKELTSITIPVSVKSMGSQAFYGCIALTSVEIPSGVTSIGDGAFGRCTALGSISVNASNAAYTSISGVLLTKDKKTIVQYPAGKSGTTYSIPSGVTSIGNSAFSSCKELTSITIPSGVTSIGGYAFYGCKALTSVTIPSGVTSIGYDAFSNCSALTSITIPSGVTKIESSTFSGCSALTSITIPSSVTSIGSYAFARCSALTSITIPADVTSIGSYAFSGCSALTSITIPSGVTSIGNYAFAYCSKLTEISFTGPAPTTIASNAFKNVEATAYYPEGFSGWTSDKLQNYGGTLTWVAVASGPVITTQPKDLTVTVEETASFTVAAEGSGLSYQWYYQKPNTTTWTKITGAAATEYSFTAALSQNGYKYKCVIAYSGGTIESRAATLTVTVKPPVIAGDSYQYVDAAIGQTVNLKVTATGEQLSYRWYFLSPGSDTPVEISGANSDTYSFTASADTAGYYFCVVENPGGHNSCRFEVTVRDIPVITDPAENLSYVIIPEGSSKTLKVTASGSGLNYEWWQIKHLYNSSGGQSLSATRLGSGSSYTIKSAQVAERNTENIYMCLVWDSKYNDQHAEVAAEIANGNIPGPNEDLDENIHIAFRYFYVGVLPKPIITAQPVSTTVNEGEKASFTVTATERDGYEGFLTPSYQWYYQKAGETTWNKVTLGGTSATYKFTTRAEINGYKFKCVVSNIYGAEELGLDPVTASVTSKVVTLTVRTKPAVTTQPKDVTVVEGGSAGFTVKASGEGLSYQWQCRSSSTGSWVNCAAASAKTATHSPASLPKYSGYQYRCKISNSVGTVYSKVVTFTVVSKPVITTQPKSITVNEGAKASFTVKATGTSLSYQWYCRSSATADWVACAAASAKTATHSPASLPKYSGYQYKCVVKSTVNGVSASVTSSIVTLTVNPKPSITAQPKDVEVQVGETASFSITAKDASSYQWYYLKPGESTWNKVTVNGTAATYTLTAAKRHDGYTYRCVVTNSVGSVTSENATLTIIGHPAITTQPKSLTVNEGSTAKFSVEATGGGLKYHWFYQKPGESEWTAVKVGGDGASYTLTTEARHNGYKYKCRVKNIAGTVYSSVVTLTVNPKPVITTQPTSVKVNAGEKATFKVAATGATSYQWYYLKPGETEWTKVSNNGTSAIYTLTTAARHNGYKYKCVVTNSAGSVTSSTVKLTVK